MKTQTELSYHFHFYDEKKNAGKWQTMSYCEWFCGYLKSKPDEEKIGGNSQTDFFTKHAKLTSWGLVGFWYDTSQTTTFHQFQQSSATTKTGMFGNTWNCLTFH